MYEESIYETKRYLPTEQSLRIMQSIKRHLPNMQTRYPELVGMSFFGSRTKGTEKIDTGTNTSMSDLDSVTFVDNSKSSFNQQHLHIAGIQQELAIYKKDLLQNEKTGGNFIIDVSVPAMKENLDIINRYLKNELFESTAYPCYLAIASMFMISIGDDINSYRKRTFDMIETYQDPDKIFTSIIKWLEKFERPPQRNLPEYKHYPKTITEAKQLFHID